MFYFDWLLDSSAAQGATCVLLMPLPNATSVHGMSAWQLQPSVFALDVQTNGTHIVCTRNEGSTICGIWCDMHINRRYSADWILVMKHFHLTHRKFNSILRTKLIHLIYNINCAGPSEHLKYAIDSHFKRRKTSA